VPRKIIHSNFQNLPYEKAIKFLSDKAIGSFLFRPSSKGSNFLTVTVKVYEETYLNVTITEYEKISEELLGAKLDIEGNSYGNLPEIIGRFVHPIVNLYKDAISFPKFVKSKDIANLKAMMKQQFLANNSQSHYAITINKEFSRNIILTYICEAEKVHIEFIKVDYKGLIFHDIIHSNIKNLINWFKKNLRSEEYNKFIAKSSVKYKINPPEDNFINLGDRNRREIRESENINFPQNMNHSKTPFVQNPENSKEQNAQIHFEKRNFDNQGLHNEYSQTLKKCHYCHLAGHIKSNCPSLQREQGQIEKRNISHHFRDTKYQDERHPQKYDDPNFNYESNEQKFMHKKESNDNRLLRGENLINQSYIPSQSQFNETARNIHQSIDPNLQISSSHEKNFDRRNESYFPDMYNKNKERELLSRDRQFNERIHHNRGYEGPNRLNFSNSRTIICYHCRQSGHKEKYCPQKFFSSNQQISSRKEISKCEECGKYNHNSKECTNKNLPKELPNEVQASQIQLKNESTKDKPNNEKKNNYDETDWGDI